MAQDKKQRIEISSPGTETSIVTLEAEDSLIDLFDVYVRESEEGETVEAKQYDEKKQEWVVLYSEQRY